MIDEEVFMVVCLDVSIDFNGEESLVIDFMIIYDEVNFFDVCGNVVFVS